jgi:DNA repair exonuclease SbcCD nuclease subunit
MSRGDFFTFLQISNVRLDCKPLGGLELPEELKRKRIEEIVIAFKRAMTAAVEQRVGAVFVVGNLWDASVVNRATIASVITLFESVQNIPVFVVPGRYDPYGFDSPYSDEFLEALELPTLPSNVYVFGDQNFETVKHPYREDVTVTAKSYSAATLSYEKGQAGRPEPPSEKGFHILLTTDPINGFFDPYEAALEPTEHSLPDTELSSWGFSYTGVGFGDNCMELKDVTGRVVGAQAGSLTCQKISNLGARVGILGGLQYDAAGLCQCTLQPVEFDNRRIFQISADISGLSAEDATEEVVQSFEDEGARSQEDIAHLILEGRYREQSEPKEIGERLKSEFFHAVIEDNTRSDYLSETFDPRSPEARFIESMLVLKRHAERQNVNETGQHVLIEGEPLSGRTVEDALYYGLDALRQKRVNLRHVD